MYNWSVDEKQLKKYPKKYQIWKLEQLINFGLKNEKLNRKSLEKYISTLKIDLQKRSYLEFLMQ